MEQLEFFTIPSPCINVCQSDARGYCLGCFRSRDERFYWLDYSEHQKQLILRLCKQRKRRRELAVLNARKIKASGEKAYSNGEFDFDSAE
ncbi:DUF1289 domain-containing protein [uncultured Shewanella sp.]|uniref:DUF1289 domain-containing protein n=1 Tax=uncultured Shewanella sp. TaxID=173975 RepID=UPI0026151101|nr:DUF1289 domain-containing protein [uncultured Shewanella sp.]